MKMKIFSLYDSKVKAYGNPFLDFSAGAAIRGLEEAIADPKTKLNRYADDYTLFEIGEYDNEIGRIFQKENHELITNVASLKKYETPSVVNLEQNF